MERKNKNKIALALICCACSFFVGATVILLSGYNKDTTCEVKFETRGGTQIETQLYKKNSIIVEPYCSKDGYTLESWKCDGKKWNFASDLVKGDMTLKANWSDPIVYNISYNYDGGVSINPTTYTVEDEITLHNAVKNNYTFVEYVDQYNNSLLKIKKGTTGDLSLVAKYEAIKHKVSINCDEKYGTIYGEGEYEYGETVTLKFAPNSKYKFTSWSGSIDGELVNSTEPEFTFTMPGSDVELSISVNTKTFNITYHNETCISSNCNPKTWNCFETLEVDPLTHDDYDFLGWFDENNVKVTSLYRETEEDVHLYAEWAKKEYSVTVESDIAVIKFSGVGDYMWGETVTISANMVNHAHINSWKVDDETVSSVGNTISFEMPKHDVVVSIDESVDTYSVTYHNVDGLTNSNPTNCCYYSYYSLSPVNKPHYSFKGWYDEDDNKIESLYLGDTTQTSIDLYAKFEGDICYITVTSGSDDFTITGAGQYRYGESCTLTLECGFPMTSFTGWEDTDSETILSMDRVYTFTVTKDLNLRAGAYIGDYQTVQVRKNSTITAVYKGSGEQVSYYAETRDDDGRVIQERDIKNFSTSNPNGSGTLTEYIYDGDLLVTKNRYTATEISNESTPNYVVHYAYDTNNRLAIETRPGNCEIIYSYNDDGDCVKEEYYYNGVLSSTYTFTNTYNLDGTKTITKTDPDGSRDVSTYTNDGLLLSLYRFDSDNVDSSYYYQYEEYEYDESGNILRTEEGFENDYGNSFKTNDYTYDEAGNLVKCVLYYYSFGSYYDEITYYEYDKDNKLERWTSKTTYNDNEDTAEYCQAIYMYFND